VHIGLGLHKREKEKTVKRSKGRREELAAFFVEYSLFMPPTDDAREAIYRFVYNRNVHLGVETSSGRAELLREETKKWQGKWVVNKREKGENRRRMKVLYVLGKTEDEITSQKRRDRHVRPGQLPTIEKLGFFKVCVEGTGSQPSRIIPIDMLELADDL